jgi:hypothetical protein
VYKNKPTKPKMILYAIQNKVIVIHVLYFSVSEVHKSQNVKIMERNIFFSPISKFWRNTYTKSTKRRLRTTALGYSELFRDFYNVFLVTTYGGRMTRRNGSGLRLSPRHWTSAVLRRALMCDGDVSHHCSDLFKTVTTCACTYKPSN